jgi:hypothetical protein
MGRSLVSELGVTHRKGTLLHWVTGLGEPYWVAPSRRSATTVNALATALIVLAWLGVNASCRSSPTPLITRSVSKFYRSSGARPSAA